MFNEKYIKKVDDLLQNHLTTYFKDDSHMFNVCKYIMGDGKRIRPSIALDICNSVSKGKRDINFAALSIEYIHSASLIIDDLPCMDNAKVRRGKECVHIKYGEAVAQLASIVLVSIGIDSISKGLIKMAATKSITIEEGNKIGMFFINNISYTIGYHGASGGQMLDLISADKLDLLSSKKSDIGNSIKLICESIDTDEIISKKTGTFFETSFLLGWIYGGGDELLINKIKHLSHIFSMVYQILDDIEDIEEDFVTNKKNISQNYAIRHGINVAVDHYKIYMKKFKTVLKELDLYSSFFKNLINFMNNKLKINIIKKTTDLEQSTP